ncbi:hypothetical protein PDIP_64810 [Penicillium digitatum Pd1]|nr:hypothetical protein PDIP_64810 [Penicillium digitatum Pd1]EKV09399.1 hypothetical protein PDIP_64810 [Penicillium digitatum Pd1]
MAFDAEVPCNVTKTSERHERPLTCVWLLNWKPTWRSGMLKHGGLSVSEEAGAKPTGKISTLSATVYVAHLVEGAFGEKPDPEVIRSPIPSGVISIVMRGCREFDVSMQSLEPSRNRTVEACDINSPDDRFAIIGVQDCCQPSLAPEH